MVPSLRTVTTLDELPSSSREHSPDWSNEKDGPKRVSQEKAASKEINSRTMNLENLWTWLKHWICVVTKQLKCLRTNRAIKENHSLNTGKWSSILHAVSGLSQVKVNFACIKSHFIMFFINSLSFCFDNFSCNEVLWKLFFTPVIKVFSPLVIYFITWKSKSDFFIFLVYVHFSFLQRAFILSIQLHSCFYLSFSFALSFSNENSLIIKKFYWNSSNCLKKFKK